MGANIEAKTENTETALLIAVSESHLKTIDLLLKKGANKEAVNRFNDTPLYVAASKGNLKKVERLLEAGVNIEAKNIDGQTPLFAAAVRNYNNIVDSLLIAGANVNIVDKYKNTPIGIASIKGYSKIVARLLAAGADKAALNSVKEKRIDPDVLNAYSNFKKNSVYVDSNLEDIFTPFKNLNSMNVEEIISPVLGNEITVPVYLQGTNREKNELATIVDIRPCQFEITENKFLQFKKDYQTLKNDMSIIPELKEVMEYILPTLFPPSAPIHDLSDENTLKIYKDTLNILKQLNDPDIDILGRRSIIKHFMDQVDEDNDENVRRIPILTKLKRFLSHTYQVVKQSQFIKVEFKTTPGVFAYYELQFCSTEYPVNSFGRFAFSKDLTESSPLVPFIDPKTNKITSHLPETYSMEQVAAIHSWISQGLLSLYLLFPETVETVCTNKFIGNADFFEYTQRFMQHQYHVLRSMAKPIDHPMKLYRLSPHFKDYPVRMQTIIATSINATQANTFEGSGEFYKKEPFSAKLIQVPAGTLILDLTHINIGEKEVIIFPKNTNLVIEPTRNEEKDPVEPKRNQYTIRNYNNVRNKNVVKEPKKGGGRRRTIKRKKWN
jgi:hypothetical protein